MKYLILTPKEFQETWFLVQSLLRASTIQGQASAHLLKLLSDSGSNNTFINSKCLPKGATPSILKTPLQGITAVGCLTANCMVHLCNIVLPEFSRCKKIDDQWAFVFDSYYDIVFWRGFLLQIGLDTCFSSKTTNGMDKQLSMKSLQFRDDPTQM